MRAAQQAVRDAERRFPVRVRIAVPPEGLGSRLEFTINGSKFPIGDFINAVISFILIAAAVYFFIVLPMNTLLARMRRGEAAPDPTTKKCPECLSDVPIAARRCAFCTSPLTEATTR